MSKPLLTKSDSTTSWFSENACDAFGLDNNDDASARSFGTVCSADSGVYDDGQSQQSLIDANFDSEYRDSVSAISVSTTATASLHAATGGGGGGRRSATIVSFFQRLGDPNKDKRPASAMSTPPSRTSSPAPSPFSPFNDDASSTSSQSKRMRMVVLAPPTSKDKPQPMKRATNVAKKKKTPSSLLMLSKTSPTMLVKVTQPDKFVSMRADMNISMPSRNADYPKSSADVEARETADADAVTAAAAAAAAKNAAERALDNAQLAYFQSISANFTVAQQRVLRAVMTRMTIAIVGMAGTGKTWAAMHAAPTNVGIMCLSASVAVNLRSLHRQIHSYVPDSNVYIAHIHRMLCIKVGTTTLHQWVKRMDRKCRGHTMDRLMNMVDNMRVIMYDEVYAGGSDLFKLTSDIISYLRKRKWKHSERSAEPVPKGYNCPFGGIPVVLIGDPGQCVRRNEELSADKKVTYDYVFKHRIYMAMFPGYCNHIVLDEVRRQDHGPLRTLAIKYAYGDPIEAVKLLREVPRVTVDTITPEMGPIIANGRAVVNAFNKMMFAKLPGETYGPYTPRVFAENSETALYLYSRHRRIVPQIDNQACHEIPENPAMWLDAGVPEEAFTPLMLKMYSTVMFYMNVSDTWTNGTMCRVVWFTETNDPVVMREEVYVERMKNKPENDADFVLVDVEGDVAADVACVVKAYEYLRVVEVEAVGPVKKHTETYKHMIYPLILAFSLTTARVQGLSFNSTVVVFENDKQYDPNLDAVKVSRARHTMYIYGKIPLDYKIWRDETTTKFYHMLARRG